MLISYYANKKSSPRLASRQPSLISFNTPIESGSIIKPCTLKHFQVPILAPGLLRIDRKCKSISVYKFSMKKAKICCILLFSFNCWFKLLIGTITSAKLTPTTTKPPVVGIDIFVHTQSIIQQTTGCLPFNQQIITRYIQVDFYDLEPLLLTWINLNPSMDK